MSQAISPFHELFADSQFKAQLKKGFFVDETSDRVPRRFATDHEDLVWIRLKKFVVMKEIPIKIFSSAKFGESVIMDFKQALRLNRLLDQALKLN